MEDDFAPFLQTLGKVSSVLPGFSELNRDYRQSFDQWAGNRVVFKAGKNPDSRRINIRPNVISFRSNPISGKIAVNRIPDNRSGAPNLPRSFRLRPKTATPLFVRRGTHPNGGLGVALVTPRYPE